MLYRNKNWWVLISIRVEQRDIYASINSLNYFLYSGKNHGGPEDSITS